MSRVNTKEKLKSAALTLFARRGFARTSIAAIEAKAGLAPRAGAFYRHFKSKQALFEALAGETITETPDEFDFDGLQGFADTRAELIALARQFEISGERQKPYLRLIDEVRLTRAGRAFEARASEAMLRALMQWVASKPAGAGLPEPQLAALATNVFGAWLFYLTKRQQGMALDTIERDSMLEQWADVWAGVLDRA